MYSCAQTPMWWITPSIVLLVLLALLIKVLYHPFLMRSKLISGLTGGNSGVNAHTQPGGGMTGTASVNTCRNHAVNVSLSITCRNKILQLKGNWLPGINFVPRMQKVRARRLLRPKQNKTTPTRLILLIDEVSEHDAHFIVAFTLNTSFSLLLLIC